MPGQPLGTYKVVGQPQANTCGLGAPDPWTFTVRLSLQRSTLYWDWLDGSPLLSGRLTQSQASLVDSAEVNADSTEAGLGPCTLQSSADLELALSAGSPAGGFSGTIAYAYTPASGATCVDALSSGGGMYSALPCSVTYSLTGTRQ